MFPLFVGGGGGGGPQNNAACCFFFCFFSQSTPLSESVLPRMPLSSVKQCCHSEISRTASLLTCHNRLLLVSAYRERGQLKHSKARTLL